MPVVLLFVYSLLLVLVSLAGGALPTLLRLTHTSKQLMMSFVGGLMLGVALLHLLPHSALEMGEATSPLGWTLLGVLTMFFLIRVFHVHQHGVLEEERTHHAEHGGHACLHEHDHDAHHTAKRSHHQFSWLGLAFGLALHSLIDGLAVGAALLADLHFQSTHLLLGLGTFLAVLLHKPLDSMSITSLMASSGWNRQSMFLVNLGFALICPLGAVLCFFGLAGGEETSQWAIAAALAFSAGVFICIALADILPEIQFHSHDRLMLSVALLLGVLVAWLVELSHTHSHEGHEHGRPPAAAREAEHAARGGGSGAQAMELSSTAPAGPHGDARTARVIAAAAQLPSAGGTTHSHCIAKAFLTASLFLPKTSAWAGSSGSGARRIPCPLERAKPAVNAASAKPVCPASTEWGVRPWDTNSSFSTTDIGVPLG